jgi:hypothetical protein
MTNIVSTTRFVHKRTVQILLGCPNIYCFRLSAILQTLCQWNICKYPGQAHAVIGPWLGWNGLIGIWRKERWWNLGCLLLCHLTMLQCKVQFLFITSLCHLICVPGPRALYEAIWATWTLNSSLLETNHKDIEVRTPHCNIADLLIKTSQNWWATANMLNLQELQVMHQGYMWRVVSSLLFFVAVWRSSKQEFQMEGQGRDKSTRDASINRNLIMIQMLHFCYQENLYLTALWRTASLLSCGWSPKYELTFPACH